MHSVLPWNVRQTSPRAAALSGARDGECMVRVQRLVQKDEAADGNGIRILKISDCRGHLDIEPNMLTLLEILPVSFVF